MYVILNATNSELITGLIFYALTSLLFVVSTVMIIIFARRYPRKSRAKLILVIPCGILVSAFFIDGFLIEYNLLYNYKYVDGTTIEYCQTGKYRMGKGILFEYHLNSRRFTNCNKHNPIYEIKVPNGKFKVRVSAFKPDIGRIDFDQPLTSDSRVKK